VNVLADLAMDHARFEVRFAPDLLGRAEWGPRGLDRAEFYVSPNPGEDLRPLARIASGGELSRLMLGIRTLTARTGREATLIFDEVDAGIGGHTADVVGGRLQALAAEYQVLCITHLPQIAAHGDVHYRITKEVRGGRTVTTVTRLGAADREAELARMMTGDESSDRVRASAAEVLAGRSRAKGEAKAKGESESRRVKGRA
jgi:DNA repair protein RecN (Recombination protein N)